MKNGEVYLDNSATMPMSNLNAIKACSWYRKYYGNPSSQHAKGYEALEQIDVARTSIATQLGCLPEELYFTSGGTEADNWALRGILKPHDHLITTAFEHHAILETAKYLESIGVEVTYVKPNSDGVVRLRDIISAKKPNTKMISVMYVNNEVGTIQPIAEIADWAKSEKLIMHTDAVQAIGHININLSKLGVDLASASAHKFGGCRNNGFLYVRKGTKINPLMFGGGQQNGLRPGTLDVIGIKMTSEALEDAMYYTNTLGNVRDSVWALLVDKMLCIKGVTINGSLNQRLKNNLNIYVKGVDAQALVASLSEMGIYVSAGAACNEGNKSPSHVLTAMGLSDEVATHSIRISISHETTAENIEQFAQYLKQCIEMLRMTEVNDA